MPLNQRDDSVPQCACRKRGAAASARTVNITNRNCGSGRPCDKGAASESLLHVHGACSAQEVQRAEMDPSIES
jgi:hypothetical protein